MKSAQLAAIEEEVSLQFDAGMRDGETILEVASRLVLYERLKHHSLLRTLDEITRASARQEEPLVLLEWRKRD